ncbi:MAG TPA: heparinase II/III family protein [Phycisphaerae bacterium]|nr:heparinase II/III family protein [Phycisphaerae bacterium]
MKRGILATRDELCSLRERIAKKHFDTIYDALRKRCSLILESAPVTEAQWRSLYEQGLWCAAVTAARTAQGRIMDLLIAHHIDRNQAFRDRAIEELKTLAGWSTWTDPCHKGLTVDLCTAEAAVGAVVGLDWLWEDLGEADRLRVLQAVRKRAVEGYAKAVASREWWSECYHSWNAVVNSGCGLAALALSDDEPAARQAYKLARSRLKHFFDALGREGGWDEGTGYWGFALRYVVLLAEAARRLDDDQTIYHARGMDTTGLFGVYFTPNGHPASFGDNPSVPLFGAFYLLAQHYGLREVAWWLDTYAFHHDVATSGWASAGLGLLFRPGDTEPPGEPELQTVKVFNEIGWAALADHWPRPRMYLAVKAGDLSANHSQRDMNSLQLQVDGEMLLTDPGAVPHSLSYSSRDRDSFYEAQACAHNTIMVAQRDHAIDACGNILDAQSERNCRWVACDAADACGESVTFLRHAVLLVGPPRGDGHALVVVDELSSGSPETVELFWHTAGRLSLGATGLDGKIEGRNSALHFAVGGSVKLRAEILSRKTAGNATDNVLRVTGGLTDRALLVSVFTRAASAQAPQVKKGTAGEVTVRAAGAVLKFKTRKHRLQLVSVE